MMNATCGIEASFAPSGQRDYLDGMTQGVALGYRIIAPLGLSIPGICPRVFIIDVIAKQTRFNLRIFAQRSPRLRSGNQCSATLLQQFNRTLGFGGYLLRAGVTPWPKLWQNLRSSAATDLARSVPSHIAASICGHTEEVAKEHYWKVGEGDLDQTMEKLSKIHSEKLAHKLALLDDSQGLESSHSVSTTCDDETKKPKESLGFVAICRLLSEAGLVPKVGDIGLERLPKTPGTTPILNIEGSNGGPKAIQSHRR
ncbi:MAG: hypothetical protein ACK6AO_17560 [Planctomycetota bacterium]